MNHQIRKTDEHPSLYDVFDEHGRFVRTFSVKLPFEVEYKHVIPCEDYIAAEKGLHEQYADKRVNGEWFDLSDNDVAAICQIERL